MELTKEGAALHGIAIAHWRRCRGGEANLLNPVLSLESVPKSEYVTLRNIARERPRAMRAFVAFRLDATCAPCRALCRRQALKHLAESQ